MPTDPPRAHILTRQSVTGENDVSLDMQEERCRAYCHERGYAIVSVSREESVRGWRDDREALAAALDRAAAGAFDVLVAWDTSRVARSVRILEQLLHELDGHRVRFESISEPYVNTPFIRQVLAAVAEEQTRTISRNVSAAKAAVARRGQWHGGAAPYGYQLVKLGDAPSVLTPQETEAAIVREVFDRIGRGTSAGQLAAEFRERGVRARHGGRLTTDALTSIVRNPVYLGHIRYRGETVATEAHPALTGADQWQHANRMLDRRAVVRRNDAPGHWLAGQIAHACGQRMYLQAHRHRTTATGWQLTYGCRSHYGDGQERRDPCTAPRPRLSAHKAGWCARRCLTADLSRIAGLTEAMDAATLAAGGAQIAQERQQLDARRQTIERRYERVRDAWADGSEPLAWLEQHRARRDADLAGIDAQIAALPALPDPEHYRRASAALAGIADLIDAADPEQLASIIAQLGTVIVAGDTVRIAYYPEYAPFVLDPHAEPIPAGLPRHITALCP